MIKYCENIEASKKCKEKYADGLNSLILTRQEQLAQKRTLYCKDIFSDTEKYRNDLKKMLGWPLIDYSDLELPNVKSTKLAEEDGFTIYRMQFEILDGVEMAGLYFEMNGAEKKPLILVQHGGYGTPELISGLYDGNTSNYNHMLERVIKLGVHAFAPQLLIWEREKYGVTYDRANIDARLKRVGSSITAVELYGLIRILDYFETKDNVSNFGMVGLSYGGFYTLYLSAIDTRIKSAISCAYYNTRDAYPWNDWTWLRSAEQFDDAEVAALVYPRKLCIELGTNDEVFDFENGIKSFKRLLELCQNVGTDWLSFLEFSGTHEFCKDDNPIEALVKDISKL